MKYSEERPQSSVAYWAWRAEHNMDVLQAHADKRLRTIGKALHGAQKELNAEARKIFKRYQQRFGLSKKEALALLEEPITRAEYDELLFRIAGMPEGDTKRNLLEARANRGAYAHRISRAEALRDSIAVEMAKLEKVYEDEVTGQLRFTAVESYNRNMFGIQQQRGILSPVPDIHGLKIALDTPWLGYSYSERIWGHVDDLASKLEEKILKGFAGARSWSKTAEELAEEFGVAYSEAETLVITETSHLAGQRNLDAYRDGGAPWYRFITALDDRTCKHCGPLDHKVFEVQAAVVGVNYPTIHPRCRCCTCAVFDKDAPLTGTRFARDIITGKGIKIPKDMSYTDWLKWQEEQYGKARASAALRKAQNKAALLMRGGF